MRAARPTLNASDVVHDLMKVAAVELPRAPPDPTMRCAADGEDVDEVLTIAGALEDASEHPIARAITAHAKRRRAALPGVRGFASAGGLGVRGEVDGRGVVVGRA